MENSSINKENISINDAYQAMFMYLEQLYENTNSDDLAGFLGSMAILKDGTTADPAAWNDWLEAVAKVKKINHTNRI